MHTQMSVIDLSNEVCVWAPQRLVDGKGLDSA